MQAIQWTKAATGAMSGRIEPFTLKVDPKGDGRWNWQVLKDETRNPVATGVASSLGAAKTAVEQFVKRSGLF
ncbi:MAG: hypothetical protein ACXWUG_23010, partial [Polyangiales bacterium]